MQSYKSLPVRVLLILACVLVIAVFKSIGAGSSGVQHEKGRNAAKESAQPGTESDVVRLSAVAKPAGPRVKSASLTAFDAAATSNAQLQNTLEWSFGGKQQRGWMLYRPLIGDLIGTVDDSVGSDFAMTLSQWQRQTGAEPTGVLDGGTWSQMISVFQSRRTSIKSYATPNQLVTIPPSDCYDPSRPEELRSAESETYAAYKRMVAAAAGDSSLGLQVGNDGQLAPGEKFLKIVSAYRSREYQEHLRKQSPNSGRAGLAVNSPHFTGRALDLYVGGEPVSTKDENRAIQTRSVVYKWLVKNATRFGFQPYFYEPWHWEYVGARNNTSK